LKKFFSEDNKETYGIYFDQWDQDWAINENNWSDNEFATDAELNNNDVIIKMRNYILDTKDSSATGNMIAWNDEANKEISKNYVDIINKNLDFRINKGKVQQEIVAYVKANCNWAYIPLNPDLLIAWIKSGVDRVGECVYTRDGTKLKAKKI